MQHIKLFENFNQPDLKDAKWIIISHLGEVSDLSIDPKYKANDLLLFELEKIPNEEDIESCKNHLQSEGFFMEIWAKKCLVSFGSSIKDYIEKWLDDNFSNLEMIEGDERCYYVRDGVPLLYIDYDNDSEIYVNFELWGFLTNFLTLTLFDLSHDEKSSIFKKWLEDNYNIKGLDPVSGYKRI